MHPLGVFLFTGCMMTYLPSGTVQKTRVKHRQGRFLTIPITHIERQEALKSLYNYNIGTNERGKLVLHHC